MKTAAYLRKGTRDAAVSHKYIVTRTLSKATGEKP